MSKVDIRVVRGGVTWSGPMVLFLLLSLALGLSGLCQAQQSGIPIELNLEQSGQVTLAIDDDQGLRVRNLISQEPPVRRSIPCGGMGWTIGGVILMLPSIRCSTFPAV